MLHPTQTDHDNGYLHARHVWGYRKHGRYPRCRSCKYYQIDETYDTTTATSGYCVGRRGWPVKKWHVHHSDGCTDHARRGSTE